MKFTDHLYLVTDTNSITLVSNWPRIVKCFKCWWISKRKLNVTFVFWLPQALLFFSLPVGRLGWRKWIGVCKSADFVVVFSKRFGCMKVTRFSVDIQSAVFSNSTVSFKYAILEKSVDLRTYSPVPPLSYLIGTMFKNLRNLRLTKRIF